MGLEAPGLLAIARSVRQNLFIVTSWQMGPRIYCYLVAKGSPVPVQASGPPPQKKYRSAIGKTECLFVSNIDIASCEVCIRGEGSRAEIKKSGVSVITDDRERKTKNPKSKRCLPETK